MIHKFAGRYYSFNMCMAIACIIASAFVHSIYRKSTPVNENFQVL